ncbi:MAG: right-handed parallel beta-helix repeat-containing protein [Victivallaceae bacterium]|nr:right-handed parallel beta-helix repeat-containing protein [Victivallaceae bacterium]
MVFLKKSFFWILLILFTITPCPGKEIFLCDAEESALRQALEKSRRIKGEKEIVIADGTLRLTSPVVLDARDSHLTLRGSEKTVISGGILLNFSALPGKPYWSAKIPEGLPEPQLLSSETANIPVAVYPHNKMAKYPETSDLIWLGSQYGGWNRPPRDYELDRITIPVAELPDFDPADAEFYLPHSWNTSFVRVKSVDRKTGVVVFDNLLRHPAGGFGVNKYQIRNIEAGLAPGKWMYHRATREVYYYPQPEEKIDSVKLTAAIADRLLTITGGDGIRIEQIDFANCNGAPAKSSDTSLNDPEKISSAINVAGCTDLKFCRIKVRNSFGNAVKVEHTPKSRSIQIFDSQIHSVGVDGLMIDADGNSVIRGCDIRDCGNRGIAAMTNRGSSFHIEKNKICGTGYCGLSFHAKSEISKKPFDVAIEDNSISKVMMDEAMHDGAGIYVFGAENFRINRNEIRETPTFELRHGIYFDETSNHCVAVGNHVSTFFPVMIHKTQNITFQDCRFDFAGPMKFDLVDADHIHLQNCTISAPEILFSAPEGGLTRENCQVDGKVSEKIKKHNFTFAVDEFGVLRCTKIPAEKKERKLPHRIVCLGDSITAAGTFAGELQLYLSCRYPREKIEVFNAGVGGDSAVGGFRRLEKDVFSRDPDMVIVCFGMNDVGRNLYRTRLPADETEAQAREKGFKSYCENMKKITDALVERGIEVIVMAPFPYDEYGTRPAPDEKMAYCNSVGLERLAAHCYNTYAPKFLFPMSRTVLCRLYAWFPELQVAKDRVHPDRRGHWVIANEIAKTVFADIPADHPLPFPMTQEMAELAKIGNGKKYPCDTFFTPLDTLIKDGEINGETAKLRQKLEILLAQEGKLKQLSYYDGILRQKGIDPADTAKADPVLSDFAQRWHLTSDLEKYLKVRPQREQLLQSVQTARKEYFLVLQELSTQKR